MGNIIQILQRADNLHFGLMQLDGRRLPRHSKPRNNFVLQHFDIGGIVMCLGNLLHLPIGGLAGKLHPRQ